MSELLDRVRDTDLLRAARPVVVLVSGGRDSVCLLDVAVLLGARVRALHVNYGLRDDADADEALCRELCERLDVPLQTRRPRRPEGNLQAWARDVRYAEAARFGVDVAAAHTITDQAETVLYRLAASPGRRALLGMAARPGDLVRPLLAFTRADTAAYCEARGVAWREASSNPQSARGRLRAEVLPALRALHPAAEANVLRTIEILRDEADVLEGLLDTLPDELDALAAAPPALARLALQRLPPRAAGGRRARGRGPPPPGAAAGGRGLRARGRRPPGRRAGAVAAGHGRARPPGRPAGARGVRAAAGRTAGRRGAAGARRARRAGPGGLGAGDGRLRARRRPARRGGARPDAPGAGVAPRRPDAPARRLAIAPGPVHRPQGPARAP